MSHLHPLSARSSSQRATPHMYATRFDDRDYKTITIWFQNKRQTSKRGQLSADKLDRNLGQPKADSCLRAVSSPSHNATLDGSETDRSTESKGAGDRRNAISAKIKPLLNSLNALTSRPRGHAESTSTETRGETINVEDVETHNLQTSSEDENPPAESSRHDQVVEQEQAKGRPIRWKKIRTLEWACEHQAKRRKLSREAYVRLGSEEAEDQGGPNDARMDSALSLLSLASSTQAGPSKDVMWGASLLLSFKHSWRRK